MSLEVGLLKVRDKLGGIVREDINQRSLVRADSFHCVEKSISCSGRIVRRRGIGAVTWAWWRRYDA